MAGALGAEVVVDYSVAGWPERVREATGGAGPGVVFDGVGGRLCLAAFAVVAGGARFVAYGVPSGGFAEIESGEAERRAVTVFGIEQVRFAPAQAKRLLERALAPSPARAVPVIGQTFPLSPAAEAHAGMESRGAVGKTLLPV